MTSMLLRRRMKNAWLLDLHRWLGGLALTFTGVHVLSVTSDTYVHFGLVSALVPFASNWHPVAVAWGVASLYLLAAVELTSLVRRRLNHRLWRQAHFLSFPLFALSTVHGLTSGTDTARPIAITAVSLAAASVAFLTAVRVMDQVQGSTKGRAGVGQTGRAASAAGTG
jgi:DMSO/TMAO reductase YedYZ heme-binding membrane subunit